MTTEACVDCWHNVTDASGDSNYFNDTVIWQMTSQTWLASVCTVTSLAAASSVANVLLIGTILSSPSLNTPPNAHLINICICNLLLTLSMLFSMTSMAVCDVIGPSSPIRELGCVQLFLMCTSFLQYLATFSAIGHYRYQTIRHPGMSLKVRKQVIRSSVLVGWILTLSLALILTLVLHQTTCALTWNPFRRHVTLREVYDWQHPSSAQSVIFYLIMVAILFALGIIANAHYWILKTLYMARPLGENRVTPWQRSLSDSSDDQDLAQRAYVPEEEADDQVYTISGGLASNFVVHYQKRQQSVTLDEVFSLENPLKSSSNIAQTRQVHPLAPQTRNAVSPRRLGEETAQDENQAVSFTDISPGAQLQRFQAIKNTAALRNQSWKKDRLSMREATKNSLTMLLTYLLLSSPFFFCAIPGVVPPTCQSSHTDSAFPCHAPVNMSSLATPINRVNITLLTCEIIFFFNTIAYPLWYFLFSKRVRKCLIHLYEIILIKLNLRQ